MTMLYAIILGTLSAGFADWLFMGVLFHSRYNVFPEVWREGRGERGRILLVQAFALITAAGFVVLAAKLGQTDLRGAVKLAAMIWLIGPLPLLLANALFIRVDHLVTATHAAGWLVKLLLIGAATAYFLS